MNSRKFKVIVVYLLAFLTGINFVVFPALGVVFTDPEIFGLTQSRFGNLFIPQTGFIILSCLIAPFLVNKYGPKKVLIVGNLLMIFSTGILWLLQFFLGGSFDVFPVLLALVACVGFGFGLSVTTLNPVAGDLFPQSESSAILILNFLIGVGTSTAPLMLALAGKNENWMYVPGIVFTLMILAFAAFLFLHFEKDQSFELPEKIKIPGKLWIFFIAIILYGFIEGTFGGFGTILLKNKGLDNGDATLGLSLFWGAVAINRLLVGAFAKRFNLSKFFLISPLIVGIAVFLLAQISGAVFLLTLMFCIGFFMGSIFPGSIGWGTIEFPVYAVLVSGFLMAADQIGTGVITQVIANFPKEIDLILRILSGITVLIFLLFALLSKRSEISEAF